jgi:hypothetical protein
MVNDEWRRASIKNMSIKTAYSGNSALNKKKRGGGVMDVGKKHTSDFSTLLKRVL